MCSRLFIEGNARPLSTMLMNAAVNAGSATLAWVIRRSSRSPRMCWPMRFRVSLSTLGLRRFAVRRERGIEEASLARRASRRRN